jgi:cytochrome c peroxidase
MKRTAFLLGCVLLAAAGCDDQMTPPEQPALSLDAELRRSINQWGPIPIGVMPPQNAAQVALGRALFFDKILSGNRDMACASCHQPQASLGDGLALAVGTGASGTGTARVPGTGRTFGMRQSPTLLNAGIGMFYFFWDGRLTRFGQEPFTGPTILPPPNGQPQNGLIGQAMLTVLNRHEMRGAAGDVDVNGNTNELALIADHQPADIWNAIMRRILAIPEYVQMFNAAYPQKATSALRFEDAAHAITIFQMEAFTKTNSPFDRYLHRDNNALTTQQKRGGLLFFGRAQCGSCHTGPFLGGQTFTNAGVPQIGPGGTRQRPLDFGRGEILQQPNNDFYRFAFRVAPLRNVELTAPYMHNGAYATLDAVIEHYNDVPKALRNYDVSQLAPAVRALYHGEQSTIDAVLSTLDFRLRQPLHLTEAEKGELLSFLKALTDPAARDLSGVAPARVPSGLPVN